VTLPQDRGLIGLGIAARNDNLDLFVDYDYQAGDGFKAHNLGAGMRYRW
jgi:outer membrane autotransporter protein